MLFKRQFINTVGATSSLYILNPLFECQKGLFKALYMVFIQEQFIIKRAGYDGECTVYKKLSLRPRVNIVAHSHFFHI